jgi:outer membrane protein assembly factor BamB
MSAQKVIDRLEQQGLLDPRVLGDLRRYVRDAKQTVPAEAVLKLLVEKQQISAFQAKKLLEEVRPPRAAASPPEPPPKPVAIENDELELLDDAPAPPPLPKSREPAPEFLDLESALPPGTPETPIRTAVKEGEGTPPRQPGEKRKRVILPPAPTAITTDDLMAPPPQKPAAPAKGAAPPKVPAAPKNNPPPVASSLSLPGLAPLTEPPPAPLDPLANLAPLGTSGDPLLGGLDAAALTEAKPPPEPEKPRLKKKKAGTWDSALLMLGGGGLGVLLILFVILWFALGRRSSSALLEKADESYKAGQYPTAQALYARFARDYPKDPDASKARVRVGMSQLRQVFDGARDHTLALRTAASVLPGIEGEPSFDDIARPELQSILPDIADSFASLARKTNDIPVAEKLVVLAEEAMTLVNNASFLPSSRRKEVQPRIESILEKIAVAQRAIEQDKALQDALVQIEKRIEERSVAGANAIRDQLLQTYPQLERTPEVLAAVTTISQREKDFVSAASPNLLPAADERTSARHDQVTLARRKGSTLPGDPSEMVALQLRGAVYGLELRTGKVRWRRAVGLDSALAPVRLPNGDFLLADQRHHDLIRVERSTNKLIWRQALAEPFWSPVPQGDQIFVALRSGRLLQLNLTDGTITQSLTFPQKLPCELAVEFSANPGESGSSGRGYQVAERSTLFELALSRTTGEPLQVREAYYLGHKPGAVVVPPVVVLGVVFVFENAGSDYSQVHVLTHNEEGALSPLREPFRLRGRVVVPPVAADGKRLTVVTDLGDAAIFAVDLSNAASPVSIAARMTGSHERPTLGYFVLDRNKLFVADTRLAEYEVLATREALDRGQAAFDGDTFVAPLQLHGGVLIHARQRRDGQAVVVTGRHLADGQTWETQLASPVAGTFAFPEKKLFTAVTSAGELFTIDSRQFAERLGESTPESVPALHLQSPVALSGSQFVFREQPGGGWVLYDSAAQQQLRHVPLSGTPALSTVLVPWGPGMLAGSDAGSLWWLDAATGKPVRNAAPFQPPLGADTKVRWLAPAVVDARRFVAVNAVLKSLHLVSFEETPQPWLTESSKGELSEEPLAVVASAERVFVATRGEQSDRLRVFSLPNLEAQGEPLDLGGRLTPRGFDPLTEGWGVELLEKQYVRLTTAGEVLWRAPLTNSPLAGAPVLLGDDLVTVGQNGTFVLLSAQGEPRLGAALGEAAVSGPRVLGKRVLLPGLDGTLHLIDPAGSSDAAPAGGSRS